MADLLLPPTLYPSDVDWALLDYSSIFPNTFGGAPKTYGRGQRWQATLRWQNLSKADRGQLAAFLAAMEGKANRVWMSDFAYRQRGSFPAGELLTNGLFTSGTTGWTASANVALTSADNLLRVTITATGGATNPAASVSGITLTNGAAYAVRGAFIRGKGGVSTIGSYVTDGVTGASSMSTSNNFQTASITVASTTGTISVGSGVATGYAVGDYVDVSYASLSRCILVDGAGQTGGAINVKGLPVSSTGLLLAGDRVDIGGELKVLTAPLSSDSAGKGYLKFQPALRTASLADATPIVVGRPFGKFVMSDGGTVPSRPGFFSDFAMTFVEAA